MKRILAVLAMLAVAGFAFAASASTTHVVNINIVEVVAIGLNSGAAIDLDTTAGAAGAPPAGDTDATKYVRYTAVNTGAQVRRITAQMSVAAPAGTRLDLAAAIGSGGAGVQGVTAGTVTLSNLAANNIITGIGNCYTGTGATDGANLTYTLVITGGIAIGSTAITITLTLTDSA